MKYKFYKEVIEDLVTLGIMPEEKKYQIIFRFGDSGWTPQKAQEIIDGVEKNKTLAADKDPYVWGNEDITVFANKNGVLLIDKMAMRAKQDVEPLELSHQEFYAFMQDFKKFIEENH
ncbi:hypothetical protein DI487_06755 [Flavobacterium sediminis]|uniref:Uncharacterized protein n=1 Tax=Flavobacterium sediminis TaxID=2201181 RepID=A0A2U8QTT2_9FLAO|nr:hypothetical protein [Flavobacterium sediminis]AWM13590.1 hypothetical protein DI487_06755 [Flavobacterium sediminis]